MAGGAVVRRATTSERRSWRRARALSFAQSAVFASVDLAGVVLALVGGGGGERERPIFVNVGGLTCQATLLAGSLVGDARSRLLADGSSVLRRGTVNVRGAVSLAADGVLWQPDDPTGRSLLVPDTSVQALVVGLSGHGMLLRTSRGTIGLRLKGRRRPAVLGALQERFGGSPEIDV